MDDKVKALVDEYIDAKVEELRPEFERAYEEIIYGNGKNDDLHGLGVISGLRKPAIATMPDVLTRQLRRQAERILAKGIK